MSRVAVVVLVLASACIDIKPFGTADGVPPPLGFVGDVMATVDGAGATVLGPGYRLHFDKGGAHYPDSFEVNGVEALAMSTGCGDPSRMGVGIIPAASSDAPGDSDLSTLTIESAGPDVARVTVKWTAQLSCGPATVDSWWEFYPDGRISRFDQLHSNATYTMGCGCGGPTAEVRTQTLYKGAVLAQLTGTGDSTPSPTSAGGDNVTDQTCIATGDFKLMTLDGPGPQPLLFAVGNDLGVAYRIGAVDLVGEHYGFSSVMPAPATTTCKALLDASYGYIRTISLHVNGTPGDTTAYDGTAGGFTPYGGFGFPSNGTEGFAFQVVDERVVGVENAPGPPGYTIGMVFEGPHGSYTVQRDGTTLTRDEARVQALTPPTRAILWLRDGIAYGSTVTVQGD